MAERLSGKNPCINCKVDRQIGNPNRWECECDSCDKPIDWKNDCVNKLAAYETAEDEGRLVVLPCKVGDVLYKPTRSFISEYKIRFIEVSSCNCLFLHTNVIKGINDTGELFKEDDIGKIVFLTREEAEKALKEMEGNHE